MMLTAEHIDDSIARALRGESHLDPAVLDILGFATPTMRHMFNNLCNVEGLRYLEVGIYCGATLCAACSNNKIMALGIDNFSQAWHAGRNIRAEFENNMRRFCHPVMTAFLQADCFAQPPGLNPNSPVHIFYFDGDHTREAQARALPHFFDALAGNFLFIVDDWHFPDGVKLGTEDGFRGLEGKVEIDKTWILAGAKDFEDTSWWNGLALFLCHKL